MKQRTFDQLTADEKRLATALAENPAFVLDSNAPEHMKDKIIALLQKCKQLETV